MSNADRSISVPQKGMNRDAHPQNLGAEGYDLALNAEAESYDGNGMPMLSNMPSNIKGIDFPVGYSVIAEKYIPEQDRILYFLAGSTDSIIGEVLNVSKAKTLKGYDTYTTILNDLSDYSVVNVINELDTTQAVLSFHQITVSACLGFSTCYKADIEYKITDCALQIYWVDDLNPNRFLYFDYTDPTDTTSALIIQQWFFQTNGTQAAQGTDENCAPVTTCCEEPVYTTDLDCNKIKVQPDIERFCIMPEAITNGSLPAGVYQFFGCYADVKGNAYSDYTPATNPIAVGKRSITINTNYNSGEGILVEIAPDSLATSIYLYYNLAVMATIDGAVSYYYIGNYPIGQKQYTLTDTAQLASITPDELFARKTFYKTARSVTRSNDYLFYSGVNEFPKGNWQRVANQVGIYWQTIVLPEGAYADGSIAARYRSYLRDEVVPLGIVIEFTNGEETPALPLIGRAATETDRAIVSGNDYWEDNNYCIPQTDCCGNPVNLQETWRIYNTASVLFTNSTFSEGFGGYNPCAENIYQWGDFAYWESTECYPDDVQIWGEMACKPIRHFKFPDCSISHIHDRGNASGGGSYGTSNWIFPIGIKVDNNSFNTAVDNALNCGYITAEMKSRIRGYRIVRGNRAGQQSILAKGLLYDVNTYNKNNVDFYYPNYPYNDLRADELISPTTDTYSQPNSEVLSEWMINFQPSGRYTFHSPNTHFGQPSIDSINELKLETLEYGESEGYFNEHLEHAKYKFLSTAAYVLALSAGVAAALTATDSQPQCREFVYRGIQGFKKGHVESADEGVKDGSNDWSEDDDKGESPYSDVSGELQGEIGGALTAIEGEITGDTETTEGHGDYWGNNYTQQGNNINASSGAFDTNTNDTVDPSDLDGSNSILGGNQGNTFENIQNANSVDQVRIQSCRSTHWQNLNSSGLNSVFGTVFSALGLSGITAEGILYKISLGLSEMKKVTDFLEEMIPRLQYAYQYNSIGFYNNFQPLSNNNRRRQVIGKSYLTPDSQVIQEDNNIVTHFNNWGRESSLYLHINNLLGNPSITDDSRITIKDVGNCSTPETRANCTISSYYGAIKTPQPAQYGSVFDIDWLETGHCPVSYPGGSVFSDESTTVFGGDTFISRFALKRKHSFFKYTAYKFPIQGDIYYSEIGNVGYPNYYFDTHKGFFERLENSDLTAMLAGVLLGPIGGGVFNYLLTGSTGNPYSSIEELLGVNMHRLNCGYESGGWTAYIPFLDNSPAPGFKKFFYQKGYVYTHYYGIPYFLCESDVNTDLRYGVNGKEGDFYPHNADLDFWLQQKNVAPWEDNQYHYNNTYSKQNKEGVVFSMPKDYQPLLDCKADHPNRVIYTEQYQQNEIQDAWLIHKAANFYDFPFTAGRLTCVDGIENSKILARFDNSFSIFNAFVEVGTNADTLAIGNGGMFASRPQEFTNTDLGHCGSQHTALLKTEYGHLWADAQRGKILQLGLNGNGIKAISDEGMRNWFADNLPFRIKKYFPQLTDEDLDSNYNGLGVAMAFDKRMNRLFVTKLDYEPLNNNITFSRNSNGCPEFYLNNSVSTSTGSQENFIVVEQPASISLNDSRYFCNRSWTASYNFLTGTWVSYHSFTPNYYTSLIEYFLSGINGSPSSTWCHGITNRHFQTYYGTMYPFIVQAITKHDTTKKFLNSIEYEMDAYRYQGEMDRFYDRTITFNKAVLFNNTQCSGLLNLVPRNENDLRQLMYPKPNGNATDILVTRTESGWRFNQFYDLVFNHRNNIPPMLYGCNNVYNDINPLAVSYGLPDLRKERIRSDYNFVRLINDVYYNHKFVFRWLIGNDVKIYG